MAMKTLVALALCVALVAVSFAQERYVKPIDEAGEDPSFVAFRKQLIDAVERKDRKFILSILDPNIRASFGGHDGESGFIELWDFNSEETRFWKEFGVVIRNGGNWYRENGKRVRFLAPYWYDAFPQDVDAFEHMVVFGERVNLRDKPSLNSKVITQLSYNVVKVEESTLDGEDGVKGDWYRVKTLGGKAGWISGDYIRSPIDHRAGFEKKNGQWKMVFLVSGD